MRAGVSTGRCRFDVVAWRQWNVHCASLNIRPDLTTIADPVPILQLFAYRVRTGMLAAKGRDVKKRSVEQYLRSVGQVFAGVGTPDPRLDDVGAVDFRIRRQLAKYANEDPAPTRVRPVLLTLLLHIHERARKQSERAQHIADLCLLAFFFLLRPGEYCRGGTDTQSAPFRIRDVNFFVGHVRHNAATATASVMSTADYVSLTFSDQKNGVKGEAIGHGRASHGVADPISILAAIVTRLRHQGASPDTALSAIRTSAASWRTIPATEITAALRTGTRQIGKSIGLAPEDVSARAMRAGGAMALLLGNVDTDKIKMLGRWKSDAMMVYLHTSARPLMQRFADVMVEHGEYSQVPATAAACA